MDDSNHEITLSSLSELNLSLRQQAVDLVLAIAVMRERADRLSAADHERNREPESASFTETEFGDEVRSLISAGPAKSRTRKLRGRLDGAIADGGPVHRIGRGLNSNPTVIAAASAQMASVQSKIKP